MLSIDWGFLLLLAMFLDSHLIVYNFSSTRLIKLTSDGSFFSLFLTAVVEHVEKMTKGNTVVGNKYRNRKSSGSSSDEYNSHSSSDEEYDNNDQEHRHYRNRSRHNPNYKYTNGGKGITIIWDTIPAYWLCIKLYMCVLRQGYMDKLQTFGKNKSGIGASRDSAMATPVKNKEGNGGSKISIFRFRIEGPRAFNTITKTAKLLVHRNSYLLHVFIHLSLHYTNTRSTRSVDLSLDHINSWLECLMKRHRPGDVQGNMQRRGWGLLNANHTKLFTARQLRRSRLRIDCTKMPLPLLINSLEILLASEHHRVLTGALSFVYRNIRRLFPQHVSEVEDAGSLEGGGSGGVGSGGGGNGGGSSNGVGGRKSDGGHNESTPPHNSLYLKLMGNILLSQHFFRFFLHWEHSIRVHFHHILVYRLLLHLKRTDVHLPMDDVIVKTANNLKRMRAEQKVKEEEDFERYKKEQQDKKLKAQQENADKDTKETVQGGEGSADAGDHCSELDSSSSSSRNDRSNSSGYITAADLFNEHLENANYVEKTDDDAYMIELMRKARATAAATNVPDDEGSKNSSGGNVVLKNIKKFKTKTTMGEKKGRRTHRYKTLDHMATDDDETVLEIYNAMMQRVLLILNEYQEYEGSDRHTMDHENVLNDLDDEDQLTRSGEPKLRRVYVKESIEEFASVLKRYYKHASKSATGDIQGPNCVVVGAF